MKWMSRRVILDNKKMIGDLRQRSSSRCRKNLRAREWVCFLVWTCKRKETSRTTTQMINSNSILMPQNQSNNRVKTPTQTRTSREGAKTTISLTLILVALVKRIKRIKLKKRRKNSNKVVISILSRKWKNSCRSHRNKCRIWILIQHLVLGQGLIGIVWIKIIINRISVVAVVLTWTGIIITSKGIWWILEEGLIWTNNQTTIKETWTSATTTSTNHRNNKCNKWTITITFQWTPQTPTTIILISLNKIDNNNKQILLEAFNSSKPSSSHRTRTTVDFRILCSKSRNNKQNSSSSNKVVDLILMICSLDLF